MSAQARGWREQVPAPRHEKHEVTMMNETTPEAWINRAAAWELLALAFLLPTRETAEVLVAGEYAAACDEVFGALGCNEEEVAKAVELLVSYEGADADASFHELRHEHTHLFIGEKFPPATPFLGVRAAEKRGQQGMLFVGRESIDVEHFMLRCGVAKDLAAGHVNDPVDHIGTVCEFLKFLCLVNARAVVAPPNAEIADGDYDLFVSKHIAEYAEWMVGRLAEIARTPFHQAAGILLAQAVAL